MKILFITSQPILLNSSANLRNVALIKGLFELGNEIEILNMKVTENAANFDNSISKHLKNIRINYVNPIIIHNNMVIKRNESQNPFQTLKKIIRKLYNNISIFDSLALSYRKVRKMKILISDYDIIISSSDLKSSHLLAKEFKRIYCTKKVIWIQYWGDPLALDVNKTCKLPKFIINLVERHILKDADYIVYVSPYTLNEQKRLYPGISGKMHFIPVGYLEKRLTSNKNNNISKTIRFGYFGDYNSKTRNILPLYSAVQNLEVDLKIIGNSNISLKSNKKILIENRKQYELIRLEEENTDVLICICNLSGTQIPGKIYHYSSLDKPILIINDGELHIEDYLNQYDKNNKFYYCDNDVESIRNKITWITNNWSNIKSEPLEAFSSSTIAKEFVNMIGLGR